jgi:aspartate dehydrogenase
MRIGVAGIGAVGADVARSLDRGDVPGCGLSGIAARTVGLTGALCIGDRTTKSRRAP